jgi:hypothetical protein
MFILFEESRWFEHGYVILTHITLLVILKLLRLLVSVVRRLPVDQLLVSVDNTTGW